MYEDSKLKKGRRELPNGGRGAARYGSVRSGVFGVVVRELIDREFYRSFTEFGTNRHSTLAPQRYYVTHMTTSSCMGPLQVSLVSFYVELNRKR
jgi:hypothetical protein